MRFFRKRMSLLGPRPKPRKGNEGACVQLRGQALLPVQFLIIFLVISVSQF